MRKRAVVLAFLSIVCLFGGYLAGCASSSGQPHMSAALDELRSARSELDAAMADKGGHRGKAIALVDDAITEVRAGIDYAASH
jgi:outer membrane murein-binding lipoprotein Lpp